MINGTKAFNRLQISDAVMTKLNSKEYNGLSDFYKLLLLIKRFGPRAYIQGETKTFN